MAMIVGSVWDSALRGEGVQWSFASINKILFVFCFVFFFWGGMGDWALGYNSMRFRDYSELS